MDKKDNKPSGSAETITVGSGTTTIDLSGLNSYANMAYYTPTGNVTIASNGTGYTGSGVVGSVGSGYTLSSSGAGTTWATISNSTTHPSIQVRGDAEFEGDLKIKGKSLVETLSKIEDHLAIIKPEPELEEKWEKLRELKRAYDECVKDIREKEKIMKILKEK